MADVFLSYKREDQAIARDVAVDLEAEGYSVFFDVRIPVGDSWDAVIERELDLARVVVVLWSPASRDGEWIKLESRQAKARGILLPAIIQECSPPLEFSGVQAADLTDWKKGARSHFGWRKLCDEGISRLLTRGDAILPSKSDLSALHEAPKSSEKTGSLSSSVSNPVKVRFSPRYSWILGALLIATVSFVVGSYTLDRLRIASEASAAWANPYTKKSRKAVYSFLSKYPHSRHEEEARSLLRQLPLKVSEKVTLQSEEKLSAHPVFSPDGSRVFAAHEDSSLRLWNLENGEKEASSSWSGPDAWELSLDAAGDQLLTNHGDGQARIWDAKTLREIAVLADPQASFFEFGSDQTTIVTDYFEIPVNGDDYKRVHRAWSARTGEEVVPQGAGQHVAGGDWISPDGKFRITDLDVPVYDGDGRVVDMVRANTLIVEHEESGIEIAQLVGHEGAIFDQSFSPDGKQIVTASEDGTARIWDTESGREVAVLRGHTGSVWRAVFSPDGSRVMTSSTDDTRIWDAISGQEIAALNRARMPIYSVFSPDGSMIAQTDDQGNISIWKIDEENK